MRYMHESEDDSSFGRGEHHHGAPSEHGLSLSSVSDIQALSVSDMGDESRAMYSIRYLDDGGDESAAEILTMSEMDSRAMLSFAAGSVREFEEQNNAISFVLHDETEDDNRDLYPEVKYDGEVVEPVVNAPVPSYPPVITFATSASSHSKEQMKKGRSIFYFMAHFPCPFLFLVPLLLLLVIFFGWTSNDTVEYDLARLWASSRDGENYAKQDSPTSSFTALATSRDGGNVLTASRLEQVRARMEITESTTISHNGIRFSWDDICADNSAPYESPCSRLSAMDMFKESRWTFTPRERVRYYQKTVLEDIIERRLPRVGIMKSFCGEQCDSLLSKYPKRNQIGLLADLGKLENNHGCHICIEEEYTATIDRLYSDFSRDVFALRMALLRESSSVNGTSVTKSEELQSIYAKLHHLAESITLEHVVDFYLHYVARELYAEWGVERYLQSHKDLVDEIGIGSCYQDGLWLIESSCPLGEINVRRAKQHLLEHADNTFSSISTAGSPFPLWSRGDGRGAVLTPDPETKTFYPVSGSGVDMSARLDSIQSYFAHLDANGEAVDPNSQAWQYLVGANPLYAWFMSSLTPAHAGTVCGNGNLKGTASASKDLNQRTAHIFRAHTSRWCTSYDVPNAATSSQESYSKQHFARMWYRLLLTSDYFLSVVQGKDDPFSWNSNVGCAYELGEERYSYTGETERDILRNASGFVYNLYEEASAIDRNLLIGGATPAVGDYGFDNPLEEVTALQSFYASLAPSEIVKRVRNCNRPGGPLEITLEDAKSILKKWKEAMENSWNNENSGDVRFVSVFDEGGGVVGSLGRTWDDIVKESDALVAASVVAMFLIAALFLFSADLVGSRVLIGMVGAGLVVLSYFAGMALGTLVDLKMNASTAWTVPPMIIALGLGDFYMILFAVGGNKERWLDAVSATAFPLAMTCAVTVIMLVTMGWSDVQMVQTTSQAACYCVIAMYISVTFCFPAYCYLDTKRQKGGRMDLFICVQTDGAAPIEEDPRNTYIFTEFYARLVLASRNKTRYLVHLGVVLISIILLAAGSYGIVTGDTGVTLEDDTAVTLEDLFSGEASAAHLDELRNQDTSSSPISINWGALDYENPDTQMKMIQQFEKIVASPHVSEMDTKQLWIGDFAVWTSRHCRENFDRNRFGVGKCGLDQIFEDGSSCASTWVPNKFGLREKAFQNVVGDDICVVNEGGICRPWVEMHVDDLGEIVTSQETGTGQKLSFCPVIDGWSDAKWKFCLSQWRKTTNPSHRFVLEDDRESAPTMRRCSDPSDNNLDNEEITWPMPFSVGPKMFAIGLKSDQELLEMTTDARGICNDDDDDVHCWFSGDPFDHSARGSELSLELIVPALGATLVGCVAAGMILFVSSLWLDAGHHQHGLCGVMAGSLMGAMLIGIVVLLSLATTLGLSYLAGANHLTGFSGLSITICLSFAAHYAVRIVYGWMRTTTSPDDDNKHICNRVHGTMSSVTVPTFMTFASSMVGILCLAFTDYEFNTVYIVRPLLIATCVTYWFGCWFLPTVLIYLDGLEVTQLGRKQHQPDLSATPGDYQDDNDEDVIFDDDDDDEDDDKPELFAQTIGGGRIVTGMGTWETSGSGTSEEKGRSHDEEDWDQEITLDLPLGLLQDKEEEEPLPTMLGATTTIREEEEEFEEVSC